ncbi:MAG: hypothetical protein AUH06_03145 [Gemmatimonadetes bacterium 13_2_20CM_69_27]|nr:MAG: hypothetical protein AUH06_03145 [Gemmatimonadetes bacterium 13_2_20CM_69_27]OLB58327.1 MAG: hypothetical protein AUI13_07065 [Gemmatimonadetes bacterium 13_2_20CM_2_69_23]OLD59330.1 MAG: hypothetical protein AUF60_05970 [Gemmatimonadetes bacterium 13_1_20CM_69_28]PYO32733.1 MAG: hypothetical protein DMD32_03115 [Gemmatimonadota bacterium]PYP23674.1 MAG: hypothetical protein DMD51_13635 [Gemmatimonadota bacterium]
MASERKNRREKPDRRSGADRRAKQVPVEVERRKKRDRRTGLTRRLELRTAGDQIQAALDLLSRALDHGVLFDEDRWLLETAITRLRSALGPLESEAGGDRA